MRVGDFSGLRNDIRVKTRKNRKGGERVHEAASDRNARVDEEDFQKGEGYEKVILSFDLSYFCSGVSR